MRFEKVERIYVPTERRTECEEALQRYELSRDIERPLCEKYARDWREMMKFYEGMGRIENITA